MLTRTPLLFSTSFAAFSLFFLDPTHASDESKSLQSTEDHSHSSEALRAGKNVQITGQVLGFTDGGTGAGANVSVFLSPDLLLSLSYSHGAGLYVQWFGDHESLSVDSYEIKLKNFIGNNFYINSGLAYANKDYHYSTYTGSDDRRLAGNTTSFTFAIGNQWQWSHFTLGCDWIGVGVIFHADVTKDEAANGIQENSAARRELFSDLQYQLIRLYLGTSF